MPTLTFRADNSIAAGPGPDGTGTESYLYTPWGGLSRDACRTYSYDGFDRAKATTIRLDGLDLLPRCEPVANLFEANDDKRYDPLGRHIWSRHDTLNTLGQTVDTEHINQHHVGLTQTLAYKQTVGAPARSGRYINTPAGTPLAVSDNNGDLQFLHRDAQNNTVTAIKPDGEVACGPDLDPWGDTDAACTKRLDTNTPNTKWYNSTNLDTATTTYQWGTRTYNPTTATWQQPDTPALTGAPSQVSIGSDPLVANRYSYVNGDPINHSDPTGHCRQEVLEALGFTEIEDLHRCVGLFELMDQRDWIGTLAATALFLGLRDALLDGTFNDALADRALDLYQDRFGGFKGAARLASRGDDPGFDDFIALDDRMRIYDKSRRSSYTESQGSVNDPVNVRWCAGNLLTRGMRCYRARRGNSWAFSRGDEAALAYVGGADDVESRELRRRYSNAIRHCVFAGVLTLDDGLRTATGILDRHEYGQPVDDRDHRADVQNNAVGMAIGIQASSRQTVLEGCYEALDHGRLSLEDHGVVGGPRSEHG